jgi:UDP-N-acetylglucosamine transferase subunit ALG13
MEGEINLSGDLSHKYKMPANSEFIGPLSRFRHSKQLKNVENTSEIYDLLILLSGPEPQRGILEKILRKELRKKPDLKVVMLLGIPGNNGYMEQHNRLTVYSHLPDHHIVRLIQSARMIVCRPGYSTIMDLVSLDKTAVLIPTPGQTEQEYLGRYLSEKNWFQCIPQNKLSIETILSKAGQVSIPPPYLRSEMLLEKNIDLFLGLVRKNMA